MKLAEALIASTPTVQGKLLGVCVGMAGVIDHLRSELRYSPILGWRSVPLAMLLQARLKVSVYIEKGN